MPCHRNINWLMHIHHSLQKGILHRVVGGICGVELEHGEAESLCLLMLLYTLQGVPMGIQASVSFILQVCYRICSVSLHGNIIKIIDCSNPVFDRQKQAFITCGFLYFNGRRAPLRLWKDSLQDMCDSCPWTLNMIEPQRTNHSRQWCVDGACLSQFRRRRVWAMRIRELSAWPPGLSRSNSCGHQLWMRSIFSE